MNTKTRKLCSRCSKNEVTPAGEIFFMLEKSGLKVKICKDALCCQKCVEREFAHLLDRHSDLVVHTYGKIITINWQAYKDTNDQKDLLLGLEVFSATATGNWEILKNNSIFVNPMYNNTRLYFKDFEHSRAYLKAKFPTGDYSLKFQLRQIAAVFDAKELREML
jgi:hypothetical protein